MVCIGIQYTTNLLLEIVRFDIITIYLLFKSVNSLTILETWTTLNLVRVKKYAIDRSSQTEWEMLRCYGVKYYNYTSYLMMWKIINV